MGRQRLSLCVRLWFWLCFWSLTISSANLSLLSGTLKTFQVHACDGEELKLECLPNTVISIYLAQYGRGGHPSSHHLCPEGHSSTRPRHEPGNSSPSAPSSFSPTTAVFGASTSGKEEEANLNSHLSSPVPASSEASSSLPSTGPSSSPVSSPSVSSSTASPTINHTSAGSVAPITCLTTQTLRYELLQKVEAACREQRLCKIMTAPKSFGGIDPCPGVRKYAEVAYKCRPNVFSNKVACEGNQMRLKCPQSNHRLIILQAFFGWSRFGVAECPQQPAGQPVPESLIEQSQISLANGDKCQVSYATETVIRVCHGKKRCEIDADTGTFGNPSCSQGSRLHLKVSYTCVPKQVLKVLRASPSSGSSESKPRGQVDGDQDNLVDSEEEGDDDDMLGAARYVPEHDQETPLFSPTSGYISESYVKVKDLFAPTQVSPEDSDRRTVGFGREREGGRGRESADDRDHVSFVPIHSEDNCSHIVTPEKAIGFISDWISAYKFLRANSERLFLYLLVSICGALVAFFLVLSSRLYAEKNEVSNGKGAKTKTKTKNKTKGSGKKGKQRPESPLSPFPGFNNEDNVVDDLLGDDLEAGIEPTLVEPFNGHSHSHSHHGSGGHGHGHSHHHHHHHHHPSSTEVVRFASSPTGANNTATLGRGSRKFTIHRQDSDTHPRGMSGNVNSYF